MRQKAAPQMINTETYVPSQAFSQDPFAPSQQQQWGDNPSGTQTTSTPINSRHSQPLFDTSHSPIAFNEGDVSGYLSDENQDQNFNEQNRADQISDYQPEEEIEEQYQGQQYHGNQSQISGYEPSGNEQYSQDYSQHNPADQSLASGYQPEQYSQDYSQQNHCVQSFASGYHSGGVDRFSSRHSIRRGRVQKKTKKRQAGTNVDREIKKLQSTTHNLLKVAPFSRLVKETITRMSGGKSFRVQSEAITALMQASEAYLITLFEASYMCTNHAKRVTLKADDMQLVRRILAAFGM
jgi:histone H3/H4